MERTSTLTFTPPSPSVHSSKRRGRSKSIISSSSCSGSRSPSKKTPTTRLQGSPTLLSHSPSLHLRSLDKPSSSFTSTFESDPFIANTSTIQIYPTLFAAASKNQQHSFNSRLKQQQINVSADSNENQHGTVNASLPLAITSRSSPPGGTYKRPIYGAERAYTLPSSRGNKPIDHRVTSTSSAFSTPSKYIPPPSLPPPTMALPPIPSVSPISPFSPISSAEIMTASRTELTVPSSSSAQASSSRDNSLPTPPPMAQRRSSTSSSSSLRRPLDMIDKQRPLAHQLSIHIPRTMTPPPILTHSSEGMPTVRDSPSMARRRKVIQASPIASRIASGKATRIANTEEDDFGPSIPPPPLSAPLVPSQSYMGLVTDEGKDAAGQGSPIKNGLKRRSIELGTLRMPEPRPSPAIDQASQFDEPASITENAIGLTATHRLEKKQGSLDLRNTSPDSPTPKRSLPRPPSQRDSAPAPKFVMPTLTQNHSVAEVQASSSTSGAGSLPRPPVFNTDPSTPLPSSQIGTPDQRQSLQPIQLPTRTASRLDASAKAHDVPQIASPPPTRHTPAKSASGLPIVSGLADAGPYPAAQAAAPRNPGTGAPNPGPGGLGLGRPSQSGQARRPVQEEVCIECMMRDRDLADVQVSGEGVWERKSDIAWEDLKSREEEILRSIGSDSIQSSEMPSLDYSSGSDDEDSASMPSTNHSSGLDDMEARRRANARLGRREQRRARKRQIDWKILHEVGWRGFKWEEGGNGEGLPRGFRGNRGGPLSEEAIKAVMKKFPSASAHRAKFMENYLYHQAILIREIRAEAQRIGHFPEPDERVTPAAVLTSDRQSVIAGPRVSSVAWGQKHTRDLSEQMRGAFDTPIIASSNAASPMPAGVRPSPSSPADLANLGGRVQALPTGRPVTHFYPDREGPSSAQRSPISLTSTARDINRKSVASAKTLDRSARSDIWADNNDESWPPVSPAESGLRPFSFAVRAGAAAGRGSADGHTQARKSLLGRWGGSVTSFFGGSQGGSGSMMDMHLGLDQDRLQRTSSNFVHAQPRAVSLASPTRPSFFTRDSRTSSVFGSESKDRDRKLNKSISSSRLSQVLTREPEEMLSTPASETKKKGIKGFLKNLKPKGHKKESSRSSRSSRPEVEHRVEQSYTDSSRPLAPPPNMAYLANTTRNRSGSGSSMLTDASGVPNQRGTAYMPYGSRSVSAPQAGSSSGGSQSASPTSSRYNRRESYTSGREMLETDRERRGSAMEMLTGPTKGLTIDTDVAANRRNTQGFAQSNSQSQPFRPHSKTTLSFSNSSLLMPSVETPPPGINGANAFFSQQQQANMAPSHSGTFGKAQSPNRHKNLPPLPPGQDSSLSTSPDSFHAIFPDGHQSEYPRSSNYASSPRLQQQMSPSGRGRYPHQQYEPQHNGYAPPRASYEPLGDRRDRMRLGEANPRLAQSMYVQPAGRGSMGSFGQEEGWPPKQGQGEDGRSVKGRKGLKSFFGGAKAGRVA